MKDLILLAIPFFIISCGERSYNSEKTPKNKAQKEYKPNPKAIELNNQALGITMFNRDDSIKVDSAIMFLDKATAIDSLYFLGYANKIQFLMIKRDYQRLLDTNEKIRLLRPHQPNWVIQRGLIYELSGDLENASKQYEEGVEQYESIINKEPNFSWEFELEFAQSLVMANQFERAKGIVKKLKDEYPDLEIWEAFKLQTKEELIELI